MIIIDRTPKGMFHPSQLQNEDWEYMFDDMWVSSLGRIWYIKLESKGRIPVGYITVGSKNQDGYRRFNKRKKEYLIHRLVYHYFVNEDFCITGKSGRTERQIDHINGDRSDNRVENLRECSAKENSNNPISLLRRGIQRSGSKNYQWQGDIVGFKNGIEVYRFVDWKSAKLIFGAQCVDSIQNACNHKTKSAYGYQWKRLPKEES